MSDADPFCIPELCNAAEWLDRARSPAAAAALQDLLAFGREQAALAQTFAAGAAGGQAAALERLSRDFALRCQKLFAPPPAAAASARFQAASQAHAGLLAGIANDAARRFAAELASGAGPPITTLGELQSLWIDCGERAFGEAAHGEAFAASQAELLAAWVELKATA